MGIKRNSFITLTLFFAITSPVLGQEIFLSIRNGDLQAVQDFFAKNPAQLEMQDVNKMTPLMFASFFGQTEVAAWLIESGTARPCQRSCNINSLRSLKIYPLA